MNGMRYGGLGALVLMAAAPRQTEAQHAAPIAAAAAARLALLRDESHLHPQATVRVQSGNTRGALIGFVVGAAVGAAAGYGAFNSLCEAVDNRCEGSRPLWMTVGGLAFGGVGALVGILID